MTDVPSVSAVVDRLDAIDLLHRFADGLDRRDWALYRSVFTDEIDLDYSSYRPEHLGRWRADDWVARARLVFPGLDATAHTITNHRVTLDGDNARITAYVRADHVVVDAGTTRVFTLCGRYDDGLVRTLGGWRITAKRLVVGWTEGDPGVMQLARDRVVAAR